MEHCCILVVDDEPSICEVLEIALEDEGHEVVSRTNSVQAWNDLEQRVLQPDLILLDLVMPQLDGQTFRSRLREDVALASIPVVLMSAAQVNMIDLPNDVDDAVLGKPFELDELLAVVASHCGGIGTSAGAH